MNERNPHDEANLERLIRAGFDQTARPDAAAREQAWQRVKTVWQAEHSATTVQSASVNSVHSAAPGSHNEQSKSQNNTKHERNNLMSLFLRNRWGFGLGAAAGVAVVVLIIALATPRAQATAAQIMARGAQAVAKLTSIHLRGQLRTLPADNFSFISADQPFYPIELWKQLEPDLKWRVEKPGRMVTMDGRATLLYIKTANIAAKIDGPSTEAFDTDWLHRIANLSHTISNELKQAQAQGWKLELTEQTAADGRLKAVVTVHAKSSLPDNDYVKNAFLHSADTRRVYCFDTQTELLERVQFYLVKTGVEVPIFELNQIDYNQPIAPTVWQTALPADVSWYQEAQKLPDNDRYASMAPEQAARAFFEACSRQDWAEVSKFISPLSDQLKESLGGVQLVSLGQPFTSQAYPGRFIPYEIRLRAQEGSVRVANTNAAKRYVITGFYDSKLRLDEPVTWSNEPALLENNELYARMSPQEVTGAFFDALTRRDWVEMRKFVSESYVQHLKGQFSELEKRNIDPRTLIPSVELGETVWSAEQSAYFVKTRIASQMKKWNLAVRKDNPAGRWQVDGGI